MRINRGLAAIAAASLLALSACGSDTEIDEATGEEVSTQTLASLLTEPGELSTVASVMSDAGLSEVFDGNAQYTVFAPTDAAFETLGDSRAAFEGEEGRPAMVALMREHIVPGYLTVEDITKAIADNGSGKVEMQTMGASPLTFAMDGDVITITAGDGTSAKLAGDNLRASNGVIVPVDAVLKDFPVTE